MFKKLLLMMFIVIAIQSVSYAKIEYEPDVDTSNIRFLDVPDSNWAKGTILKLAAQKTKIFNGYPDGTFRPQKSMSRAEFITTLIRALGYEQEALSSKYAAYQDVPEKYWASKYISMAKKKGIIADNDYSKFYSSGMANGEITRYEACKMIANSLAKTREIVNDNSVMVSVKYTDVQSFDPKSKRIVYLLANSGILKGYPNNTVKLEDKSTRAEIAAFVLRFIENSDKLENMQLKKEDVVEDDYRDNVKYVGKSQLPAKMEERQYGTGKFDVQATINKVSMFKYDGNYKGEYKNIFTKINTGKAKYFTEYLKNKIKNANILVFEVTMVNNSGYEVSESNSFLDIEFPNENINIIHNFHSYEINRIFENKVGNNYWVSSEKKKNIYKFTTFYIVDNLPKQSIKLSKMYLGYIDPIAKKPVSHNKENYQFLGIDLTR